LPRSARHFSCNVPPLRTRPAARGHSPRRSKETKVTRASVPNHSTPPEYRLFQ
jgi:hypothetical protein